MIFEFQPLRMQNRGALPGAETALYSRKNSNIEIHQYKKPFFYIRYLMFKMVNKISFIIKEHEKGIRFEAVLTGELVDSSDQNSIKTIRSGEYRLSDKPEFRLLFKKNSYCSYFITRYSD
jgi:hypothetical protein